MKLYRNYEKTRKAIRNAFIDEVIEKKDFDSVTVKNIIERADIAKSTYYYHYKDIDTLVNEICLEIVHNLEKQFVKVNAGDAEKRYYYISELTSTLKQYDGFFRALFKSTKSKYFISLLNELLTKRFSKEKIIIKEISDSTTILEKAIIIDMLVNGITYSFVDYYNDKLDVSIDALANVIIDRVLTNLFIQ